MHDCFLVVAIVGATAAAVLLLLNRLAQKLPPYVWLPAFFALLLPSLIVPLLPIDISRARYTYCLVEKGSPLCRRPALEIGSYTLHKLWTAIYWNSFASTW